VGDEVAAPPRAPDGRFVKGVSGNPAGRPKGIRNETSMVKEFIANALVKDLQEDALEILAVAIKKAKNGDNAMIRLLLKDLIAQGADDESENQDVVIRVKNMTLKTESDGVTIDHEDIP
jgi:hypothetical protein